MRVYLAGPDVFLPDPLARGAALKAVCARHGLTGIFPLDQVAGEAAWADLPEARRIALQNEAHIRSAAALVANLTPFRGPSADVGTVFEMGFARALGLPVFAWSNDPRPFTERTLAAVPGGGTGNGNRDAEGMLVEAFGCTDNLMIDGAVAASGGTLVVCDGGGRRWADLAAFTACIACVARCLGG